MTKLDGTTVSITRDERSGSLVVNLDGGRLTKRVSLSPKKGSPGEEELAGAVLDQQARHFAKDDPKPITAAGRSWHGNSFGWDAGATIRIGIETVDNEYLKNLWPMYYELFIDPAEHTVSLKQLTGGEAKQSLTTGEQRELMGEAIKAIPEIAKYRMIVPEGDVKTAPVKVSSLQVGNQVLLNNAAILTALFPADGDLERLLAKADESTPIEVVSVAQHEALVRVTYQLTLVSTSPFKTTTRHHFVLSYLSNDRVMVLTDEDTTSTVDPDEVNTEGFAIVRADALSEGDVIVVEEGTLLHQIGGPKVSTERQLPVVKTMTRDDGQFSVVMSSAPRSKDRLYFTCSPSSLIRRKKTSPSASTPTTSQVPAAGGPFTIVVQIGKPDPGTDATMAISQELQRRLGLKGKALMFDWRADCIELLSDTPLDGALTDAIFEVLNSMGHQLFTVIERAPKKKPQP